MRRGHSMDTILTLMLFGLFTGCLLMVLMLGAQSYQKVVDTMEESYETRTCLQYIATKVSHYSGEGALEMIRFGEGNALALYETIDDCPYVTYLYLYDGQVMELFCEVDVELSPQAGFSVMAVDDLTIQQVNENLLYLTCTGGDRTAQLYLDISLHSGEGGVV